MDKARRIACLTELGVTIYRRRADGELEAERELALPDEDHRPAGQKMLDSIVGNTERGESTTLADPAREQSSSGNRPVFGESIENGGASSETSEPSAKPLKFRLNWCRSDSLLLLDAVVDSESGDQAGAIRLRANMLKALGHDPKKIQADLIEWPFAGGSSSAEAASEMMTGFISEQLEQHFGTRLLLVGSDITMLLLGEEMSFDELVGARINLMDGSLETFVLPGYAQMLSNPLDKVSSWQLLKTLRQSADSPGK